MSRGGGKSGKSGRASKQYNSHGDVQAALCWGPLTHLRAVLYEGKAIYEGDLALSADSTDLTGYIEPKFFGPGGYLKLIRGTATQAADAAFADLAPMRGLAMLVCKGFLLGREKNTAPNLQAVVSRLPVVSTSIVAGADNVLDDQQCNPVALLAELFLAHWGLAWGTDRLVAADWLAAAAWCNASAARRGYTFCSPLLTSQVSVREAAAQLLAMFDGALYFAADGTLGLRLLQPGTDPGGLTTLDAPLLAGTRGQVMRGPGWRDIATAVSVQYVDRARKWKSVPVPVENGIALRLRGEAQIERLDRPHVTRRDQAQLHGAEAVRRSHRPSAPIRLTVRRAHATGLDVGLKTRVDIDPEPGGAGESQLCIIEEVRRPRTGPVTLTVRPDTLVAATPYQTAYVPAGETDPDVASIPHALIVPLPPRGFGDVLGFAVLAARPDQATLGARVFFDADDAGDFAELGLQRGFAVRCSLDTGVDDAATTLRLTLLDGASGPDAYLAGLTAGTDIEAAQDILLAVIATVDGDGRVDLDADGRPLLEFCSVVSRTAVDADTHDYTVIRARRSLTARAWTTAAQVWLVPGASIEAFVHPALGSLLSAGDPGYVRLAAYTALGEDDSDPLPEWSFLLAPAFNPLPAIAWTSPADAVSSTDGSGNVSVDLDATDPEGDLVALRVDSLKDDGTTPTTHADLAFEAAAARGYAATLNFGTGTWVLTVQARDRAGNLSTSQRTVYRSAGGPVPPSISPASGATFSAGITITVTAAAPADRIHWAMVATGVAVPGSWSTEGDLSLTVNLTSSKRLWVRASDGSSHSAWVSAEYYRDSGSGGGSGGGGGWPPTYEP